MDFIIEKQEEELTTIQVTKTTRARLDSIKITKRETKDEICNRLMDFLITNN